jgi:hypothetical protein
MPGRRVRAERQRRDDQPLAERAGHGDRPVITEQDLVGRRLLLLAEGHCLREQALAVCGHNSRKNLSTNW